MPVGRPLPGVSAQVVDARLRPVPVGAPGELLVSGPTLATGYVGLPDATAERFVTAPVGGARAYRTGDLVRRLGDGTVEFLGRVDDQVKIRGHRVEPGEVAQTLLAHPWVDQAVVLPREDSPGDVRLVAYVVLTTPGQAVLDDLARHLRTALPEPMVPSAVVPLDAFPLLPNGKVDRAALPAPQRPGDAGGAAPSTATEEALLAIWQEVIGLADIGVDEDFFALGGHSLMATQVIARVRSGMGVHLPLHTLFTAPTVAALAAVVDEHRAAEEPESDAEMAAMLAAIEGLSEEEAEALLAAESAGPPDAGE